MKECGIYAIANTASGSFYIGSSTNLAQRKRQHWYLFRKGRHGNAGLGRAWAKYGPDALRWEVVALVPPEDLEETERRLLARVVGRPDCYNISHDPITGMRGHKHTPETKALLREMNLRRPPPSAETRAKMSAANKGRVYPPDVRARFGAPKIGKKRDAATIEKLRAAALRRSPETIEKIRQASLRWWAKEKANGPVRRPAIGKTGRYERTDAHREVIIRTHTGKVLSEETRRKISDTKRRKREAAE